MLKYISYNRADHNVHMVIAFHSEDFYSGPADCRVLKVFHYRAEAEQMKRILQKEARRVGNIITYACIEKRVYY